jgi:predicted component of type VI protein secretion system
MSQLKIPATIRAAGASGASGAAPRSRRGLRRLLLSCAMLSFAAGPVQARLQAATPAQQQAAEAKKAKEAETAKEQADALARVQDRLAAQFGKGATATEATRPGKISQKAAEADGSTGPHGGTSPSAEAHGGEAARR